MRNATFLLALYLAGVLALAQISSLPKESLVPQPGTAIRQQAPDSRGDSVRMWSRAEIRVVPLDVVAANRVELQSLRDRQAWIEAETRKLEVSDPAVREQISRQLELIRAVLAFADRQDSNYGKGSYAIEVQRRLNQIEGRMMCDACHTSVVAETDPRRDHGGRHASQTSQDTRP